MRVAVVVVATGAAAAIDLRSRRVPNWLTFGLAAAGLALAVGGAGRVSLVSSIAGVVLGCVLMLPGYWLGATGAGDVKLLGAVGAVIGGGHVMAAFLVTAIAGGAIAVGIAVAAGRVHSTFARVARLDVSGGEPAVAAARGRIAMPYAPAIAIGAIVAVLLP